MRESIAESINLIGDFCGQRDIEELSQEALQSKYGKKQADVMVLFGGSILCGGDVLAQAILDARALFPDCTLADLYDQTTMPPELRKAHQENDKAVMRLYGFPPNATEPEIVAELMRRYQELTASA